MTGKVLGLDYGERRIGVAMSDPLCLTAQPHSVLDRTADWAEDLRRICIDAGIVKIVVGLPLSLRGEEGVAAERARDFGRMVADITGLDVEFIDERFTTVQAEQALLDAGLRRRQRRDVRDKVAAAVMLQGYLDRRST